MPVVLAVAAVASLAAAGVSAYESSQQAKTATKVANYNANVDIAQAQQLAMDANANIAKQRLESKEYLSKQRAAYAASGVLGDTGSPLAVQATTAGRMEQDIQQYWSSTQQKESSLYAAAQEGVYEGAAQASMYHLQGAAEIMQGIGSAASYGAGAYGQYQKSGSWTG